VSALRHHPYSRIGAIPDPPSLTDLRRRREAMLPRVDTATGNLLENFYQAFSHLGRSTRPRRSRIGAHYRRSLPTRRERHMISDQRFRQAAERAVNAVESQEWLDKPSYKLEHGMALALNLLGEHGERVGNFLHGTWLGDPLHPLLTNVPIGAWTAAMVLDATEEVMARPGGSTQAAQACVGAGVIGGVGAALAGLADWQYTHDRPRRTGLVHGALNTVGLGLYAWSWLARRRGAHRQGRLASGLGYAAVLFSGYLGGTLVYRHQIGVDHTDHGLDPRGFVAVLAADDLADGSVRRVEADGVGLVLVRHGDQISALGERCPHLGAPMASAWIYRQALECPWHGSRFDLTTGANLSGPATAPLPCFDTRLRNGRIEVRRRPPNEAPTPRSHPSDRSTTRRTRLSDHAR